MDHDRPRVPTPMREYGEGGGVPSERWRAQLEADVSSNGEDLRDLRKAFDDLRESSSELKKAVNDDRLAVMEKFSDLREFMAREFGKLEGRHAATSDGRGDLKWMIGTVVALVALAVAFFKH